MKELDQLLEEYSALIQRYRYVMELELQSLKESGELDEGLNQVKQEVVDELGEKLVALKAFRETTRCLEPAMKLRLDEVQHQFMQVVKLDREVEKSYLGRRGSGARTCASSVRAGADRAAAKRYYGGGRT